MTTTESRREKHRCRIGKHERWILEWTYRKTVLRELPASWLMPRSYRRQDELQRHCWLGLHKSEVLLNHFHLRQSFCKLPKPQGDGTEYFLDIGPWVRGKGYPDANAYQRNRAMVTYHRAVSSLQRKGLIDCCRLGGPNSDSIILTGAGTKRAVKLLNINDGAIINVNEPRQESAA